MTTKTLPTTPSRPARGRPRHTPHPTATLLLDTTVELLDTVPIDALTIAMIRERSGVSYGSIYHHYADISDLTEQAGLHRYTRNLQLSLEAVRALLDATDAADLRTRAEQLFEMTISPDRRKNRFDRVEVLGALQGRPRLAARLGRAQQEITDGQAEVFAELQRRGWLRADTDPLALSAFVQAMILGRVVDDVAERHVDPDAWAAVALRSFRAIFFPD